MHEQGAKVELYFKQNSLVVHGHIRMIEQVDHGHAGDSQAVRTIEVDVPGSWSDLKVGTYDTPQGFPLYMSHGRHFVDASKDFLLIEWPYRTTVGYDDSGQWHVIELCEKMFPANPTFAPHHESHMCSTSYTSVLATQMARALYRNPTDYFGFYEG